MWRHSLLAAILLVVILPIVISAQPVTGPNKHRSGIVASVKAVLDAQVAAWNRGDIEGYMAGYWRSDKTIFVSGDSVWLVASGQWLVVSGQ